MARQFGFGKAAFMNGAISRRSALRGSLLLAGGLALGGPSLSACGNSGSSGDDSKRVVVAGYGGAIQDAEVEHIYKPFTEETGIEVVMSGPPTTAKIKAMVDSGNVEWDIAGTGNAGVIALGTDYFERFPDAFMSIKGVDPHFLDPYSINYYVYSSNIAWNTELLGSKKMEDWADFWNSSAFAGKRTMLGGEGNPPNVEAALLADGVAPEDLYPLDLDRALDKFAEIKPNIAQWWGSGAQPGQMLVSKQVSAAEIWSGRIFTLQDEGAPIDFTWKGGKYAPASFNVVKGAKNKEGAFQLVEYAMQPEVQARVWGSYPCGPTNTLAYDTMDAKWARRLPTFPENAAHQFNTDSQWWGENNKEVMERWTRFLVI